MEFDALIFVLNIISTSILIAFLVVFILVVRYLVRSRKEAEDAIKEDETIKEAPFIQDLRDDFARSQVPRNYIYLEEEKVNSLYSQIYTETQKLQTREDSSGVQSNKKVGVSAQVVSGESSSQIHHDTSLIETSTHEVDVALRCSTLITNLMTNKRIQLGLDRFDTEYDVNRLSYFLSLCKKLRRIGAQPDDKWVKHHTEKIKGEPEYLYGKKMGDFKTASEGVDKFVLMRNEFEIVKPDESSTTYHMRRTPKTDGISLDEFGDLRISVPLNSDCLTTDGKTTIENSDKLSLTVLGHCNLQGNTLYVVPLAIIH